MDQTTPGRNLNIGYAGRRLAGEVYGALQTDAIRLFYLERDRVPRLPLTAEAQRIKKTINDLERQCARLAGKAAVMIALAWDMPGGAVKKAFCRRKWRRTVALLKKQKQDRALLKRAIVDAEVMDADCAGLVAEFAL